MRLPAGNPPLIRALNKRFSFCIPQSSFTLIPSLVPSLSLPLSLSLSLIYILHFSHSSSLCCPTPAAVELLMGCWAGENSLAADLLVGVCVASFFCCHAASVCVSIGVWTVQDFKSVIVYFKPVTEFWGGKTMCAKDAEERAQSQARFPLRYSDES